MVNKKREGVKTKDYERKVTYLRKKSGLYALISPPIEWLEDMKFPKEIHFYYDKRTKKIMFKKTKR